MKNFREIPKIWKNQKNKKSGNFFDPEQKMIDILTQNYICITLKRKKPEKGKILGRVENGKKSDFQISLCKLKMKLVGKILNSSFKCFMK